MPSGMRRRKKERRKEMRKYSRYWYCLSCQSRGAAMRRINQVMNVSYPECMNEVATQGVSEQVVCATFPPFLLLY